MKPDQVVTAGWSAQHAANAAKTAIDGEAAIWAALAADATQIDDGASAADIAGSPLWPAERPREIAELWRKLKRDLHAAGEDWDVWTDWYEARLAGKRSNKKLEIARATIPNEIWEQGPAVVNAHIKNLIAQHKRRPAKKDPKPPAIPQPPSTLPAPLENVPSALTFGWTAKSTITVVTGPLNRSVLPYPRNKKDHADRLEACHVSATDLLQSLKANRWNAGFRYADILGAYIGNLPAVPNEGNFLLADAKYRILRSMFAAEQSFLPVPFAAELQILCEQHIALRAFYPHMEDFYNSIRSGHLDAPLPIDAVEAFINTVQDNTPNLFEPIVSQSLEGVAQPVPTISTPDNESPKADTTQPSPPRDPLGEIDPAKSQRFTVASSINSLWKELSSGGEKVGKNVEGWNKALTALAPFAQPILQFLRSLGFG